MHTLPNLSYSFDALEPHIDARTMEIHHDKHHAAYVTKLNTALEGEDAALREMDIVALMRNLSQVSEGKRTAVRNNGGGHCNHSLYWEIIGPNKGGRPTGELLAAIEKNFGSFETFQEKFSAAAATHFGAGWAWLSVTGQGLAVTSTANQDSPYTDGPGTPILTIDVWEHAYYLKYQNRRPDHIAAFWKVINWDAVAERFSAAR